MSICRFTSSWTLSPNWNPTSIKKLFVLFTLATLSLPHVYAAENKANKESSPIEAKLTAQLVVTKNGKHTFVPATKAVPGDIIKYDITYKNVSASPVSGLTVEGPIPIGTYYLAETAKSNLKNPRSAKLEVSVDDTGKWAVPPVYRMIRQADGSMKKVEVNPAEYKKLRWVLSEPLLAKSSNVFSYWVKVPNGDVNK